ncbi:DUF2235 domain-containing protein [Cupriavidus sp. amp6]|uniref:T6SS phospholipase effector Tle1-like catalytic domain-containing protein n=1 Tax=Cupriavidus sp. amp6 TaxID=388051 RepID=UPI0009FFF519|nr:DUF2235 domain-containing protein [Cupriavidus sp. amp6]
MEESLDILIRMLLGLVLSGVCGQALAENNRVPLAPQDRLVLQQAFSKIHWTPQIGKSIDGRPVVLGAVLFDGTENDRLHVPNGERQTVVGHIHDRLQTNNSLDFLKYYAGVGTQSNPLVAYADAAIGFSLRSRVDRALDDVLREISRAQENRPDADVRLFISGFSRGGAAARHFMNLLEKRWAVEKRGGPSPRIYALVFDTVATGQRRKLDLQVPQSADLFYHFVSLDERRIAFPPIVDVSKDLEPDRIVTITIPGAHSDVGGSYASGIGTEYLANIDSLLAAMGLIPFQCFSTGDDPRAKGKNDSRWLIDKMLGIGAPNTVDARASRKIELVESTPVPIDFGGDWVARMRELQYTNGLSIARCVHSPACRMLKGKAQQGVGRIVLRAEPIHPSYCKHQQAL